MRRGDVRGLRRRRRPGLVAGPGPPVNRMPGRTPRCLLLSRHRHHVVGRGTSLRRLDDGPFIHRPRGGSRRGGTSEHDQRGQAARSRGALQRLLRAARQGELQARGEDARARGRRRPRGPRRADDRPLQVAAGAAAGALRRHQVAVPARPATPATACSPATGTAASTAAPAPTTIDHLLPRSRGGTLDVAQHRGGVRRAATSARATARPPRPGCGCATNPGTPPGPRSRPGPEPAQRATASSAERNGAGARAGSSAAASSPA